MGIKIININGEFIYDPTKEPVIIYNPSKVDVASGKLAGIGSDFTGLIGNIDSGAEDIKSSGYSGVVDIDTAQVGRIGQGIDDIVENIEDIEALITDYAKGSTWTQHGYPWFRYECAGTFYTRAEAGARQTEIWLEKAKGERNELVAKIERGEATYQEFKHRKWLEEEIKKMDDRKAYLNEKEKDEEELEERFSGVNLDEYFPTNPERYARSEGSWSPEQIGRGYGESKGNWSPEQIGRGYGESEGNWSPEQIGRGYGESEEIWRSEQIGRGYG